MAFPTKEELEHSRKIEQHYLLYRGEYGKVLNYFPTVHEKKNKLEVVQNLAGAISRVFADLMFLKEPKITHGDEKTQEQIDELFFRSKLSTKLYQSALAQSFAGKTGFETRLQEGVAYIDRLNPATLFPQWDHVSTDQDAHAIIVAWKVKLNEGKEGKQDHLFQKVHTPGKIEYRLNKFDPVNGLGAKVDISAMGVGFEEEEATGLDKMPVWIIDNQSTGQENEGISDYDDIKSLLQELTRVHSQIATQLKNHADAKMAVPAGVLDEKGEIENGNMEMFEIDTDDQGLNVPEYITNQNPLLPNAETQVDKMIEAIARIAEVSTLLLDINVAGGAEKVGALLLRLLRTLAKVERKLVPYKWNLKDMIATSINWQSTVNAARRVKEVSPLDISCEFFNGLPEDKMEKILQESQRLGDGTQSLKGALMNIDKLEGEALEEKIKEIEEEQEQERRQITEGLKTPGLSF